MALIQGQKNHSKVNSATEPRNPFFVVVVGWVFFMKFRHMLQPCEATRFFQLANKLPNIINFVLYSILS